MGAAKPLRVGVLGCGLIAQVMHLPHLRSLPDLFEIVALCDLSPGTVEAVGESFAVDRRLTRMEDLLEEPLDAVLILTSGDHAPAALEAARSGRHVFVEKPLCRHPEDGRALLEEARRSGVRLMVGYMKRYDPSYRRLLERLGDTADVRLATGVTMESPEEPYVRHHGLRRPAAPEPEVEARAADERRAAEAIGTDDPTAVAAYRNVLLDSMVHDLNLVRGALGEPDALEFANVREEGVTAVLSFGGTLAILSWVRLPGIARYRQEFAFLAPDRRGRLIFPSPYLRDTPTQLVVEEGDADSPHSWQTVETVSYENSFKLELLEFHSAIVEDREPATTGRDALCDVLLCGAIVASHLDGRPRPHPTRPSDEG